LEPLGQEVLEEQVWRFQRLVSPVALSLRPRLAEALASRRGLARQPFVFLVKNPTFIIQKQRVSNTPTR